jgi:hypothetical protein
MNVTRLLSSTLVCTLVGAPVWAQDSSKPPEDRPAVTSFWGDTGLWFVPTAEVLKPGGWAFGAYRTELDFKQGFTDVSYYPGTLAIGVGNRTEIFAAVRAVTSIDRDTRPLFAPAATGTSGVVNEYPMVRQDWTGHNFGDIYVGTKVNLLSESRRQPLAMALRGTVKLPTAGEDNVGTGQFDYFADFVMSKEISRSVELAGFGGYAMRGDPDGVSLSDGLRWGFGAAFASRASLRFTTELHGEIPADDAVVDWRRRFDLAHPHGAGLAREFRRRCDLAASQRDVDRRWNELSLWRRGPFRCGAAVACRIPQRRQDLPAATSVAAGTSPRGGRSGTRTSTGAEAG